MIKHDMNKTGTVPVPDKGLDIMIDIQQNRLCNGIIHYTFGCFCFVQFYNLKPLCTAFQSYHTETYIILSMSLVMRTDSLPNNFSLEGL